MRSRVAPTPRSGQDLAPRAGFASCRSGLNIVSKRIKDDPPLCYFTACSRGGMCLGAEPEAESSSSDSGASRASRALRSRWGKVAAVAVVASAAAAASAYVPRASNQAPTITQATVTSELATTGQILTFAGLAPDADGDSLRYTWNFGDNSTAIGAAVSHAYSIPGRYVDLLTVTDGRGGEATNDARLLFVQAPLPPSQIASPSRPPHGSC